MSLAFFFIAKQSNNELSISPVAKNCSLLIFWIFYRYFLYQKAHMNDPLYINMIFTISCKISQLFIKKYIPTLWVTKNTLL